MNSELNFIHSYSDMSLFAVVHVTNCMIIHYSPEYSVHFLTVTVTMYERERERACLCVLCDVRRAASLLTIKEVMMMMIID